LAARRGGLVGSLELDLAADLRSWVLYDPLRLLQVAAGELLPDTAHGGNYI